MIDEMQVFRSLGIFANVGEKFCSPFRSDSHAGCFLKPWGNYIYFYDNADPKLNCKSSVQLYSIIHNLEFNEAIEQIKAKNLLVFNKSFAQHKSDISKREVTKTIQTPVKRNWNQEGRDFWKLRGVTKLDRLFQVGSVIVEQPDKHFIVKVKELCFCYVFDNQWKMYTPFAEKKAFKFVGTVSKYNCWWKLKDSDTLVTLKANKDFLVIESIVDEFNLDCDLNHWNTENVPDNKATIPNYSKIKKYKRHISITDNDVAGIRAAENCRKHLNSITPFVPGGCGKDIDEFYLMKGREAVVEWFKNILSC